MLRNSFAVFLILMSTLVHAQEKIRYAAELSHIPQIATIAALGDAGVALPVNAGTIFWNPAAGAFIKKYQVLTECASLYEGLSTQGCFVAAAPVQKDMNLTALYSPFLSGDIASEDSLPGTYTERLQNPGMRSDGIPNGYFQNNQNVFLISIARLFPIPIPRPSGFNYPIPVDVGVGCNFRWYWQTMNLADNVRMGINVNLDVGAILRVGVDYDLAKKQVSRELLLGASVRNALPTSVIWVNSPSGYQEIVDPDIWAGAAYIDKTGILWAHWTLTGAIERSYTTTYHGGVEAELFDVVALRAGLSDKTPTLGAGVHYTFWGIALSLDYAFRFDEVAVSPVRVSVGAEF